ncbi:MAG: hypothetical protein ACO1OC_10780 [Tuberibacillus sp.]
MVKIRFNELNVDSVTRSSGIFSGRNQPIGWRSNQKVNQGFGEISGNKNETKEHIHLVIHAEDQQKR